MPDALKILETVNTFYTQSFSQLINITVAVLVFSGIALPILVTLYQKRLFRLDHQNIEQSVHKKLKKDFDLSITTLQSEYEKKENELEEKMQEMKNEIGRGIAKAEGGIFHIQANHELKIDENENALKSFIDAALKYIEAEHNLNLRVVLTVCSDSCLPALNEVDLKENEELAGNVNQLIEKLTEYNEKDTFTDQIRELKYQMAQVYLRKPAPVLKT